MKPKQMVAAAALAVSLTEAAAAAPLADLQGRKRVFLLFAPSQTTSLAQQSKDLLADRPGLAERDLVVLTVLGKDEVTPVFGEIPGPGASAGALRAYFEVADAAGFTAILVGKDGGEKWRQTHPICRDALYRVIDAMPMRREEAGRPGRPPRR